MFASTRPGSIAIVVDIDPTEGTYRAKVPRGQLRNGFDRFCGYQTFGYETFEESFDRDSLLLGLIDKAGSDFR
jgi:hypothetical protein